MKAWLAVALFVSVMLAGCTKGPADLDRSDDLRITVQASTPFLIAVPLPTDDITTPADWEPFLHSTNGKAELSIAATGGGAVLWIAGNGTVHVEGILRRSPDCCASSFAAGTWSTGQEKGQAVPIFLESGNVSHFSYRYEATSCEGNQCGKGAANVEICSRSMAMSKQGLALGESKLVPTSDSVSCSEI